MGATDSACPTCSPAEEFLLMAQYISVQCCFHTCYVQFFLNLSLESLEKPRRRRGSRGALPPWFGNGTAFGSGIALRYPNRYLGVPVRNRFWPGCQRLLRRRRRQRFVQKGPSHDCSATPGSSINSEHLLKQRKEAPEGLTGTQCAADSSRRGGQRRAGQVDLAVPAPTREAYIHGSYK